MRMVLLAIYLCLALIPAFIQPADAMQPCALVACGVHPAPAPLIGGLPAAVAIGGVWLGRKLLKRNRRPQP